MRIAYARESGKLAGYKTVKTPDEFSEMIAELSRIGKEMAGEEKITAVVGGIGAPLDDKKEKTIGARWVGEPLKESINEVLGAPVYLENDAALAGLGEAVYGAGKERDIVAYMTISTGVGGARIVVRSIEKDGHFEPGRQIIDADSSLCEECERNDLESCISGSGVEKRKGVPPKKITDMRVWDDELPRILAYGLNNLIGFWSPDVIVLGGSMIIGDPAISVEQTEIFLKKLIKDFAKMPDIKKASLGDLGGVYGALEYARQTVI